MGFLQLGQMGPSGCVVNTLLRQSLQKVCPHGIVIGSFSPSPKDSKQIPQSNKASNSALEFEREFERVVARAEVGRAELERAELERTELERAELERVEFVRDRRMASAI